MLDDLPFGPGPEYRILLNEQFRSSLVDAIELYSSARQEALRLLYRGNEFSKERTTAVSADFEEVAASCGHFSYSLENFAEEMRVFLDILDELKDEVDNDPRQRSWKWLWFWRRWKRTSQQEHVEDQGPGNLRFAHNDVPPERMC